MARSIWKKLMGRRLNRETLEKSKSEGKLQRVVGELQPKPKTIHYKQLNFLELFDYETGDYFSPVYLDCEYAQEMRGTDAGAAEPPMGGGWRS